MFLIALFAVLTIILAAPELLRFSRLLAAHLSEIQPEQHRLVTIGLGAVLLVGVYALGQSLYPARILPQGAILRFNILIFGIWALVVLTRHRPK